MTTEDTVNELRDLVKQRNHHDEQAAKVRTAIDAAILRLLKDDPDRDREELAQLAEVSTVKIREIARLGGIPPRKRGGSGRRYTKGT